MILPPQCTPLNTDPVKEPRKIRYSPGRFYNRTAVCQSPDCRGTVIGTQNEKRFTGRCCVCGRFYTKGLRKQEDKWFNRILQELKKYNYPDVKLWSPEWAGDLPLPVLDAVKTTFIYCSDPREFLGSMSDMSRYSYTLHTQSDRRRTFKTGDNWIALLESYPGCPAGLKILSKREESKVSFGTVRSQLTSIFSRENRSMSGHFIKMSSGMEQVCSHWGELDEQFRDDLLGERADRSVFVHQAV